MKQDKRKYLYVCDNCDHDFYMKTLVNDRLVECSRCGEKTAYCDVDLLDDDIDIDDRDNYDFEDDDFLFNSESGDNYDYAEW